MLAHNPKARIPDLRIAICIESFSQGGLAFFVVGLPQVGGENEVQLSPGRFERLFFSPVFGQFPAYDVADRILAKRAVLLRVLDFLDQGLQALFHLKSDSNK